MGDVYMVNGKILSGLPNNAKDIIFDNTGTDFSSTNTEDAIKEVNSNLSKHSFGTAVNITSYQASSNAYVCPSDGYILAHITGNGEISVKVNEAPILRISTAWDRISLYVRKGTVVYTEVLNNAVLYFYPLE